MSRICAPLARFVPECWGAVNSNLMSSPSCLQEASSARFSLELSSRIEATFVPCSCSNSFIKARAISGRSIFYFGKWLQHISECSSKNSSQCLLPDTPLYSGEDMSRLMRPPGCLAFLLGILFTFSGVPLQSHNHHIFGTYPTALYQRPWW